MRYRFPLLVVLAVVAFAGGSISQPKASSGLPDKVFVLVGDEQVLGRAPLTAETPDPRLFALVDGTWQPAVDPLGLWPSSDDGVGPGMAFGEQAVADLGGPTVGLIVCGSPHTSMASWKGRKKLYRKCEQQARSSEGRIVGFVFVEGTWDSSKATIANSWPKAFREVLKAFRSDLGVDAPAVVAQIGQIQGPKFKYVDAVRTAQGQAALERQTAVVDTSDLAIAPNGVDFTSDAYQTLGERLENAWWQLVDPSSIVSQSPPDQVFILAGQSNMLGRGLPLSQGTPATSHLWNWRAGFWRLASDPLGTPTDPENGIGPGMTFGTSLLSAEPGTRIGLVMCAVGSTGISDWQPNEGPFQSCVRHAVSTGGVVAGLLFLQGERDATQRGLAQKWATRFNSMLAGFRAIFGDIPAVVAKIADITAPGHKFTELVQEQQDLAATQNTNVRFFPTADEPLDADGLHYTVQGYKDVGTRFAANWLFLTGGP
ncbi:MAG: sialate O-acetylesterase [Verrucomicrobiota bacterium]